MVLDATANFVRGTTDASVNSTQTTISVSDASIFPDPSTEGEYNVVIWDADTHPRPDQDSNVEVLRVTGRDTTNDDLTVSRGQESTSGANHPSGAAIHLSPTAKMFGDIESTFNSFWDAANSELTADVNNTSVSTDSLVNIADRIIGTANEIEGLSQDASDGETVVVGRPETPYELSSQVTIDGVTDFTLIFQSRFSADGNPILKAADGADVGGIFFGSSAQCEHVTVKNYGWDGNHPNQDQTVNYLDGLRVNNVTDFTLDNFYISRTSPYHEHGTGGSGVSVKGNAVGYTIKNGHVEDVGDRGIQCGGLDGLIQTCTSANGFDRFIAADMADEDGAAEASHLHIRDCHGHTNAEGSAYAMSNAKHITIDGCTWRGQVQTLVRVRGSSTDVTVSDCHLYGRDETGTLNSEDYGIAVQDTASDIQIEGCKVKYTDLSSLYLGDNVSDVTVRDFTGRHAQNARMVRASGSNITLVEPDVRDGGTAEGIRITGDVTVRGGEVRRAQTTSLKVSTGDVHINGLTLANGAQGGGSFGELYINTDGVVVKNVDVEDHGPTDSFNLSENATNTIWHNNTCPDDSSAYTVDSSASFASKAANFPAAPTP
jgi:hypothetical protein